MGCADPAGVPSCARSIVNLQALKRFLLARSVYLSNVMCMYVLIVARFPLPTCWPRTLMPCDSAPEQARRTSWPALPATVCRTFRCRRPNSMPWAQGRCHLPLINRGFLCHCCLNSCYRIDVCVSVRTLACVNRQDPPEWHSCNFAFFAVQRKQPSKPALHPPFSIACLPPLCRQVIQIPAVLNTVSLFVNITGKRKCRCALTNVCVYTS